MRRMRSAAAPVAVLLAGTVLAGCQVNAYTDAIEAEGLTEETRDDPRTPIGPGGELSVVAFDLGFRDLEGTAIDGPVEVTLVNEGQALHNFVIDEAAVDEEHPEGIVEAAGGETQTGVILLFGQPGGTTYTYYCNVPGHRAAGMEGQVIVYADEQDAAGQPVAP